jgi:hypothetical protein
MRRLLCVGRLLSFGGCALCESSGQRYVVFFRGSSAQMEDAAETVLVGAASWEFGEPAADIAAVLTVAPAAK